VLFSYFLVDFQDGTNNALGRVINVVMYAPSNGRACLFYKSCRKNVMRRGAISLIKDFTLDGVRLPSNAINIMIRDFIDAKEAALQFTSLSYALLPFFLPNAYFDLHLHSVSKVCQQVLLLILDRLLLCTCILILKII
jgi:hypothetical protein